MAIRTPYSVTIFSRNNRDLSPTQGEITKVEWDKKERTQNSVKALGMWLAFTCCGVIVPVAHYFLVPTLFITSWIMFLDKLNEKTRSEGGEGECPKCHQKFRIEKSKFGTRLTDSCGTCHEEVEILFQEA